MIRPLVYPDSCIFCGALTRKEDVCADCLKRVVELTAEICPRCGALPEDCNCMNRLFAFRRNISAFSYEGPARTLLLRFKQRNRPQLYKFMARRMYFHITARFGEEFDGIVYVPQSYKSFRARGYYPMRLLAKELARHLELSVLSPLKRIGNTQQKYVEQHERWGNAKQNYALRRNARVKGKLLLIDDLFTSGATLNACAELLREAGAEEVYTATFAIAAKKS